MKKLASVLALTAVVANLGLATVFAQTTQAPSGSQTIGCDTTGTVTIASIADQTFTSKTTNFTSESNADLTTTLAPAVTDTRGFDPSVDRDCSSTPTSPHSFTLDISSPGLTKDSRVSTDPNYAAEGIDSPTLHLTLGTALTGTELSKNSNLVPSDLASIASAAGSTGDITSGKTLVTFAETFSGTVTSTFPASGLQVDKTNITVGAASPLSAGQPIPAGSYSGTITFTLAGV